MSNLQRLHLVVASPSDVQTERDAVETVAAELNDTIGDLLHVELKVHRWETDAFPDFDPNGAQSVIDKVLKIEDCDILVGIFWKRFGTPTSTGETGTQHEIRTAYNAWLQKKSPAIMLYFSAVPYTVDTPAEAAQVTSVVQFKQMAAEWGGLWWRYDSPEQFETLLRGHLTQRLKLLRRPSAPVPPAPDLPIPDTRNIADRYTYIARQKALINEAKSQIVLCTNKLHRSDENDDAREINAALRDAHERTVEVRVLVADGFDRLPGAIELSLTDGIPVRFDPDVHVIDINYSCFDGRATLIAARKALAGYEPSRSQVEFSSAAVTATLLSDFDHRWKDPGTRTLGQYLRERLRSITPDEIPDVASQWSVPESTVAMYMKPDVATVCIIGRPGSGKSTVAKAIRDALVTANVPRLAMWFSDVTFLWQVFNNSRGQDPRVEAAPDGGFVVKDPTLYAQALVDLAGRATRDGAQAGLIILEFSRQNYLEAFGILKAHGIEPNLVVYLDVELSEAKIRNRRRSQAAPSEHYVSEVEMNTTFASDDLEQLKAALGARLLVLSEQGGPARAIQQHAVEILERLKTE